MCKALLLTTASALCLSAQAPPAAAPKGPVAPAKPKPAVAAAPAKPVAAPAKPAVAKPAVPAKPVTAAKPVATVKPKAAPMTTDNQKIVYAVGLSIARSLKQLDLSPEEAELVKQAITDTMNNAPAIALEEWGPRIQQLAQERAGRVADREKAAAQVYLDKAAAEPGAVKTETGLVYKDIVAGTGASPAATDTVRVHYRGTLTDGTEFDSSYKRNEPAEFPLNQVIKAWTEGVQKMKVGGKARLVCPSAIAYGDRGSPPAIPGGATLIFEIELLSIPSQEKK